MGRELLQHPGTLIIRSRQQRSILELFFDSLWSTINKGTKIILVDDGAEYSLRNFAADSRTIAPANCEVLLIEHQTPQGSASCLNEALAHVEGDIVYIVDTDILLLKGWQNDLKRTLDASETHGAIGAALIYPQTGGIQHCGIAFSKDVGRHLFLNARPEWIPSRSFKVQAVVFALCAIKRQAIEAVGPLDENYYNAYEDLDYFLRIQRAGYNVLVDPSVKAYHWELSDGPHRSINRKRNLGRFWRQWGDYIESDIWLFIQAALKDALVNGANGGVHELRVVDLCEERPEATTFTKTLQLLDSVRIVDHHDLSYRIGDRQEIWLPQILGIDGYRQPDRYLFLVDNFVRLLGNRYWIELRATHRDDDLVADLHGTVIKLKELFEPAWPGTKIR